MLPIITVKIFGLSVEALVDSGCQRSVVREDVCKQLGVPVKGPKLVVEMLNGELTRCHGEATVKLEIDDVDLCMEVLIATRLVCDARVILGTDVIERMDGVFVGPDLRVRFGALPIYAAVGVSCQEENKLSEEDEEPIEEVEKPIEEEVENLSEEEDEKKKWRSW